MSILEAANANIQQLMVPKVVKLLDLVIKKNCRVAQSVGSSYVSYLRTVFKDLI
jgi:hypothetical protein